MWPKKWTNSAGIKAADSLVECGSFEIFHSSCNRGKGEIFPSTATDNQRQGRPKMVTKESPSIEESHKKWRLSLKRTLRVFRRHKGKKVSPKGTPICLVKSVHIMAEKKGGINLGGCFPYGIKQPPQSQWI